MTDFFSVFPLGTLLQSEAGDGLRAACKQLSGCAAPAFAELVAAALALVRSGAARDAGLAAHPALAHLPAPADAAACARALLALTLDFARCGTPGAAVRSALEDSGLAAARAEAYAAQYAEALGGLREALCSATGSAYGGGGGAEGGGPCAHALLRVRTRTFSRTNLPPTVQPPHTQTHTLAGAAPPRLVDVTWRLDFLVSSKELGRVARPTYRVRFLLADAQGQRSVEVACSPQELEDLQARLHTAVQAAEALASA